MENLLFQKPTDEYIKSYWETFDEIAKEGKYLGAIEAFPLDSTVDFIRNSIEKNIPYIFVVDKEKNKVIAWCDAQPKSEEVGRLGIAIKKEYRGNGLGKVLLNMIINESKDYGYKFIELEVREDNKRAIHLYEKIGFKKFNMIKNGLKINGIEENVVEMRLEL